MIKKPANKGINNVALLLSSIIFMGLFFVIAPLPGIPIIGQLGIPLVVAVLSYVFVNMTHRTDNAAMVRRLGTLLPIAIVLGLLTSNWFAIQSLWVSPFDPVRNRFVLENLSVGILVFTALLVMILSGLQRNVFWPTKRKPGELDEREIIERGIIFEKSYKFGITLSVLVIWGYLSTVHSLPDIISINGMGALPGHYFTPAYSLVVGLFALPLIIAAYRKR